MTKEKLIEMGLTEEQADKVMAGLDGAYVTKSRFNEVNTELSGAKNAIKERDKQLEALKTSTGDTDSLKEQIAALQAENKAKDETHTAELMKIKKESAIEKALTGAKAKNITATKALLSEFLEKAEMDSDGTLKGLDAEIKKLIGNSETGFLFDTASSETPKISGASPAGVVTAEPDVKHTQYSTRLADARKTGDTLTAIKIKQEAAAEGVVLI